MLHLFESTKPGSREDYKAKFKNHNLSILRYMWMGDRNKELTCLMTGTCAFRTDIPDHVTGKPKTRFTIEFNHIRQQTKPGKQAGDSKDKDGVDPGAIFRAKYLDKDSLKNKQWLVEFMCIMPINKEYHRYISQDSAKGNITLKSFPKDKWPWVLKRKSNFNKFIREFGLNGLDYDAFIDHLSDIRYAGIANRLKYIASTDTWKLTKVLS